MLHSYPHTLRGYRGQIQLFGLALVSNTKGMAWDTENTGYGQKKLDKPLPLSYQQERSPMIGMGAAFPQVNRCRLHCFRFGTPLFKLGIELDHELLSTVVVNVPQAQDERLCSS